MTNRSGKLILFVFFLSAAIDLKFIALAEETTIDGKITRIEQKFITAGEANTVEGIIARPVMEYESDKLRDPFERYLVKEVPKELPQEITDSAKPKLDLSKLKVQGIIWGVKTPQAIINAKVLTVGDLIEGAKILKIEKKGVTLGFNGEIFDLAVPGQSSVQAEEIQVK
ncbi:MAG: hypothetical protein NTX89_02790 [Candidatus Omnitrophica bacterium]|nr:hypothetical protein [Candidatus Omnitrophota bacterium]